MMSLIENAHTDPRVCRLYNDNLSFRSFDCLQRKNINVKQAKEHSGRSSKLLAFDIISSFEAQCGLVQCKWNIIILCVNYMNGIWMLEKLLPSIHFDTDIFFFNLVCKHASDSIRYIHYFFETTWPGAIWQFYILSFLKFLFILSLYFLFALRLSLL